MKKLIIMAATVLTMMMLTSGALALSYDGGTFNPGVTLDHNNPLWFNEFSLPTTGSLETAVLDMTFENATPSQLLFSTPFGNITVDLQPNGVIFTNKASLISNTLQNGPTTFTFTGSALSSLNAAINSSGVPIGFYLLNGSIKLDSAHLYGTMKSPIAPEPVSMALVGAGLVGLPFVRRMRRSMIRE